MKVYVITCHGGEYDDVYSYINSIHYTFEGAKKEAIRIAESENDKAAIKAQEFHEKYGSPDDSLSYLEDDFFSVAAPSDDVEEFFKLSSIEDFIEVGPVEVRH